MSLLVLMAALLLDPAPEIPARPLNILLLIADDLGVDRVRVYDEHPSPGKTPAIDELAAEGLLFRNAWSAPVCSPSRAMMLTGRRPAATGMGTSVKYDRLPFELSGDVPSLADVALAAGFHTVALGKWHLSSREGSGLAHPLSLGFDEHRGTPWGFVEEDGPERYTDWEKVTVNRSGSRTERVSRYATSVTVDDALECIAAFGDEPRFLWTAFHAPHQPVHEPPDGLHSSSSPGPWRRTASSTSRPSWRRWTPRSAGCSPACPRRSGSGP